MAKRTRKETEHPLFGQPCDLPCNVLLTTGDVMRYIRKLKEDDETEGAVQNSKFADKLKAVKEAAGRVYQIWEMSVCERTKIPTTSLKAIINRCKRIYEKCLM